MGVGKLDGDVIPETGFQVTPVLDQTLEVVAGLGRYVWYAGLALVAGAIVVLTWRIREKRSSSAAVEELAQHAGRALWIGALVLHVGLVLRTAATVALVTRGYGTGSLAEDLRLALLNAMGLTLVLGVVASALFVVWVPRLRRADSGSTLLQGAVGIVAIAALASATSHTSVLSDDPFGIWISTLHVSAASAWLGPLLIVIWASRKRSWRSKPTATRAAALRNLFGWFAPVALVAFVVLVLTGMRSAWLLAGAEFLSRSAYTVTLWVKLALVAAVVLPVALHHDSRAGGLAGRRCACKPRRGVSHRSLGLEASALGVVLVAATVLAGLNPAVFAKGGPADAPAPTSTDSPGAATASDVPGGRQSPSTRDPSDADVSATDALTAAGGDSDTSELLALLSDEPPEDVAECQTRTVGQANCYRDYFAVVMREDGADAAVAEIVALAETDEYIARDCHQVAHDLGNDAAIWYGDIGIALTYEGSACWSGYYHGVVEYAISQFDGTTLYEEIPAICISAATDRYSLTHYNCVHGLGHGVMLNLDGDLFGAIPYCETLLDPWELSSCVSGIMMENVVSAQQGIPTEVRTDDLLYPCNAIAETYVDECFAMQTSWMLSRLGYTDDGFSESFALCDTVRTDMIDDCYRSMGRDISGVSLLAVDPIIHLCGLGHLDHQQDCYVGAALNAVYNDHDTTKATELCRRIDHDLQQACYRARDQAASAL